jgi:hypothetical protein
MRSGREVRLPGERAANLEGSLPKGGGQGPSNFAQRMRERLLRIGAQGPLRDRLTCLCSGYSAFSCGTGRKVRYGEILLVPSPLRTPARCAGN